jgi:hypothetical protein
VNFKTHPFSSVAITGALLALLLLLLLLIAVSLLMKGRSGVTATPASDVPLPADVTADVTGGLETMPIDTPATGDLIGTPAMCVHACMRQAVSVQQYVYDEQSSK